MSKHSPNLAVSQTSSPCAQAQLGSDFQSYLVARGYVPRTRDLYGKAVEHFLHWLGDEPFGKQHIDPEGVQRYLDEHLLCCDCPYGGNHNLKTARAALNQLLLMLGGERLHPPIPSDPPDIEALIGRFDTHLEQVCGLAEATRWYQRRNARTFLRWQFGDTPMDCRCISAEDLRRFMCEQACAQQLGSVGVLAYSLRTFLRFLNFEGEVLPGLIGAVPRPPQWSLASLPPSLSEVELERFWATFDRCTPMGRRDYAMARSLADLGLRCQEVAHLHLEDIDWREGTVRLCESKSRRTQRLPLPQITGAALIDYLSHGRPVTSSRSIFVLHRAPMGQAVTNTTVRGAYPACLRTSLPAMVRYPHSATYRGHS